VITFGKSFGKSGSSGGGSRRHSGRSPSDEVFDLRKLKRLDEAYEKARERMAAPDRDAWDERAYGWCLVDLVRRHAQSDDPAPSPHVAELQTFTVPEGDELLAGKREEALALFREGGRETARAINRARELSKTGQFGQAAAIYTDLFRLGRLVPEHHANFGWDLQKATRERLRQDPIDRLSPAAVDEAKRNLNTYLKLRVERPSLLHSVMMQMAASLASDERLNLIAFSRLWNLELFRPEDFDRFEAEDGKVRPSLAEKVVQQIAKEAFANRRRADIEYVLTHVECAIRRSRDNIWLKHAKAKLLRDLGRPEEACQVALEFARAKSNEYWAWELLGDLQADPEVRLACHCRALLCSQDDSFVSKLRLKLARELVEAGHFPEAKGEIIRVIAHKTATRQQMPSEIRLLTGAEWYESTEPAEPRRAFYEALSPRADEMLFSHLPWTDACLGESFAIEGREGKPRRRIYVRTALFPVEASVSEGRFRLRHLPPGTPVKVRTELDCDHRGRITVVSVAARDEGRPYDVFRESIGVIDHVNPAKGVLHFTVSTSAQGVVSLADFGREARPGDGIAVRLATFHSRSGPGVRVLSATATDQIPGPEVRQEFRDQVRVDKGMGFTDGSIFIPPQLITAHRIEDGDFVSGVALLSYNRKRSQWGWKALLIEDRR
jgi:hypothetical protein